MNICCFIIVYYNIINKNLVLFYLSNTRVPIQIYLMAKNKSGLWYITNGNFGSHIIDYSEQLYWDHVE